MREWCFRWRGVLLALLTGWALFHARPVAWGLLGGLPFSLAGELLRCWAVGLAGDATRESHLEAPLLITSGPYAWTRNPLYLGTLLNVFGLGLACFAPASPGRLFATVGACLLFYRHLAQGEEEFLRSRFGTQYVNYARQVPAWLPRSPRSRQEGGSWCAQRCWRCERSTLGWWVLIWSALLVKSRWT